MGTNYDMPIRTGSKKAICTGSPFSPTLEEVFRLDEILVAVLVVFAFLFGVIIGVDFDTNVTISG